MKKLITFLFGSMVAVAATAQTRQAQVTIQAPSNMEVRIDGITYSSGNNSTIPNLTQGTHAVDVYEIKAGGLFGKKREHISSTSFTLRDRDITISVDQYGQARISESGSGSRADRQNRGRTDNTWAKGKHKDKTYDDNDVNDDDDYKKAKKAKKAKKSNGNGKKLGHYKNGKL